MNNNETGHGESHTNLAIRQSLVAGAAVGVAIPIAGMRVGDSIKAVMGLTLVEGVPNTITAANHDPNVFDVAAGSISSATIVTTGQSLIVTYIARHPLGGDLNRGI